MAKCDVLKEELPMRSEGARKCEKDDFKHPNMLKSGPRNGNDTKVDGIFGRHTGSKTGARARASQPHPNSGCGTKTGGRSGRCSLMS